MKKSQFIDSVVETADRLGYKMKINRDGLRQIDFGHKKLHEGHLAQLYPEILQPGAHIPSLIESVAPGRSCVHRPMREIVEVLAVNK